MGVPAFFRWLSRQYPSVIVDCIEQMPTDVDGEKIPVDSSSPNPNGIEFDNLYLDMNGIIHPCTHPEDKPAPKNEDEMMIAIFECVDRLFKIVRPRKLLYMAIDGVAPCAKMNQQRSRRFRASKESQEKIIEIARIREELAEKGATLPPEKKKENHFDLNCITPGTEFMDRLSRCLHYYIHDRLNNDPGWRNIKVILSDAKVPGEGEHKIMDYIRKQRAQPDHDPNTQHVLCGADADLIMLGLATHEPNFTIIREEFKPNKPKPCDICGQLGHEMKECVGISMEEGTISTTNLGIQDQYIFVRLNVLREYLERELQLLNLPFEYNFERALDDWVFMCFFVGNDFLPHLPSLEIREGAINRLMNLYKKTIYKTRGWLTDSGDVNLDSVQMIMSDLGQAEDEIFKKRQQTELMFKAKDKARKRLEKQQRPNFGSLQNTQFAPMPIGNCGAPVRDARREAFKTRLAGMQSEISNTQNDQKALLGTLLKPLSSESTNSSNRGIKRKVDDSESQDVSKNDDSDDDHQVNDEVRLWEDGFKDRYYESKFDVTQDNLEFRYNVALQYVRGLCWVLRYYYQGCASWKWYFPYHYAPFASDFVNIGGLSTQFEKGTKPIKPLEQLMSVFPAASRSLVPVSWAKLMTDPDSIVIDFYPEDFKIDLNGKKFAWQGVALLPFVEEKRLFKALSSCYDELTEAEKGRNSHGCDRVYVGTGSTAYGYVKNHYLEFTTHKYNITDDTEVPFANEGMRGLIMIADDCIIEGGQVISPIPSLPFIKENQVICARYKNPIYPEDFIFPAVRLKGVVDPPRVLKPGDLTGEESRNWRPRIGMVQSTTRASLAHAGHRMMGHHLPSDRMYNSVQPPASTMQASNYSSGGRYGNNRSHGGYNQSNYGGDQRYSHHDAKRSRFDDGDGNSGYGYNTRIRPNPYYSAHQGGSGYSSNTTSGNNSGSRGGYNANNSGRYNSSNRGYSGNRNNSGGGYGSSNQYPPKRGNHGNEDGRSGGFQNRERTEQNQWGYGQKPSQGYGYQRRQ